MLTPNQQPTPQSSQPSQASQDVSARNKQRGTGFSNINSMLQANQGAGQKMGQQIGSSLTNQAGQIQQGIKQGQSGFQAGMATGSAGANAAISQGQKLQKQKDANGVEETDAVYQARLASSNPTGGQDGNPNLSGRLGATTNPELQANNGVQIQPIVQQPMDLAAMGTALTNAAYQGPQGLSNAGQLSSRAATTSALGQLGATGAGQGQLLASQVAKRGNYGQGQTALDQMLLGKGGQQAIQQGRSAIGGIQNQAQGAIQGAEAQANATQQDIEGRKVATTQALQNQLSGAGDTTSGGITGFTTQAAKQASDYNTQADRIGKLLNGINPDTGLATSTISPSDLTLLQNMSQYGIDPNQQIYGKTATEQQGFLGQLGNNPYDKNTEKWQGQQAAAANALGSFLGDQNAGKFGTASFTSAFNPVTQQNLGNQMGVVQASDVAQQQGIQGNIKQIEDARTILNTNKGNDGGGAAGNLVNSLMASLTPEQQATVNAYHTTGQKLDQIQGLLGQNLQADTGNQKSIQQLALERFGQAYTPVAQNAPRIGVPTTPRDQGV